MKKVYVKATIKNEDGEITYEGEGKLEDNQLIYKDNNAIVTIFLKDDIMLREIEDTILSYKFRKNSDTSLKIYLKELKQTGSVPMKTYEIKKSKNSYNVIYQIEDNEFKHIYNIEWRLL